MKRVMSAGPAFVLGAVVLGVLMLGAPATGGDADPPVGGTAVTPSVSAHAAPGAADKARPDSAAARRYAVQVPTPPDSTLVRLLREGNRVLLFRHAATDWGQRDADLVNYGDRAAQRNLSAIGRAQADSIGRSVKALGLEIGQVYASPMYRCRDTAEIAFGRADTTRHLFVKAKESREARVKWLSTPLTDGALLVLVSHQDPYLPLFKFERDQLKEGDGLLIEPSGGDRWKILAQLAPADWARLAAHDTK